MIARRGISVFAVSAASDDRNGDQELRERNRQGVERLGRKRERRRGMRIRPQWKLLLLVDDGVAAGFLRWLSRGMCRGLKLQEMPWRMVSLSARTPISRFLGSG